MQKTNLFRRFGSGLIGLTLLSVLVLGFISPETAHAATCDKNETIIIECGSDTNGIWAILLIVINVMSAGVGVLAVLGIVYASILWTTAEDKADQVNKAKGIITNVIIGLLAFVLMWAGLNFIVPGGVFDRKYSFTTQTNTVDSTLHVPAAASTTSGTPTGGGPGDTTGAITSVNNLRDAAASSGKLKSGALYRSAQLSKLTTQDSKRLANLLGTNATIIDLRTATQRSGAPDKAVAGVKNVSIPIAGVLDTTPMVTDSTRGAQLAKALRTAANAPGTVLIHCVAGKDRTGWMVAMIMYANGASDDQVMKEYLLSNGQGVGIVKKEWLTNGVQAARSKHGSVINYLKSIGLTTNDISKLKTKFGA
jgi:hypothetical protein